VAVLVPPPAAAQAPGGQAPAQPQSVCPDDNHAAFHQCATEAAKKFDPPRTPDGKPNLSGYWRKRAASHEDLEAHVRTPDDAGGPSIVVDPADGKVPMQPWADARRRENAQKFVHHNALCYMSGVPGHMYMTGLYEFIQTPEHLVVQSEETHAFRIIPLDGSPHIGKNVHLWQGDSRARWEGNTLVIDTTNQNARVYLDQRGRFFTEQAHVVERLTPVDANTMHYQATITDPNVFTRPFTIAMAYRRNAAGAVELWEEGCYENNEENRQLFRSVGYGIYPGISAREAQEARRAWETREAGR
jgi:hypothetical protein